MPQLKMGIKIPPAILLTGGINSHDNYIFYKYPSSFSGSESVRQECAP
jgi:hypothetical protein